MNHTGFRKSTAEIELRFSRKMVKTARNMVGFCFSSSVLLSFSIYSWPRNDGFKIALGMFIANLVYSILEYLYCLSEYKIDNERYNNWVDIEHYQSLESSEIAVHKENSRILLEENKELREKLKAYSSSSENK